MVLLASAGSQVSAQFLQEEEGVHVSELTGLEITFSEDWAVDSSDVSPDGDYEIVYLESDTGFMLIGFGLADDPENSVTSTVSDIDGAEMIDGDSEADFAWGLASYDSGYVYVESENGFVDDYQLVAALISDGDIVEPFELAQDTVSIDGGYVFVEHDAEELEALVDGAPALVDEDPTPESEGNLTETGNEGRDSSADDDSYQFEQGDVEVVVSNSVTISEVQIDEGYEQVLLVGSGAAGAVSMVSGTGSAQMTLTGFMSGFLSELGESETLDSGMDGGVAWALYLVSMDGADMYVYVTVDDSRSDDMHYLELIMAPEIFFEDQFVEFQDSVEINGDSIFADTDVQDLLDIIEGV